MLSCVRLFVIPWTVACQAPLSVEFSRQEYWNELPFPSPGYLPNPGIKPRSSTFQSDSLPSEPQGSQADPNLMWLVSLHKNEIWTWACTEGPFKYHSLVKGLA